MSIVEYQGKKPKIGEGVFLAPGSWIIGDVTLGDEVTVWTGAIIRGDDNTVTIGARSTVLENCIIEAPEGNPVEIGKNVIISHGAIVHGATVRDHALVGIGATVLDGAIVGEGSIVAACALVAPRKEVPENMLAVGIPAKPVREIEKIEKENVIKEHARTMVKAAIYKKIYSQ
jgi:carbonic anhydrase/acetyltransferase-like protein (isoleucine patch superfamily)